MDHDDVVVQILGLLVGAEIGEGEKTAGASSATPERPETRAPCQISNSTPRIRSLAFEAAPRGKNSTKSR